jgi:hypothetical protein
MEDYTEEDIEYLKHIADKATFNEVCDHIKTMWVWKDLCKKRGRKLTLITGGWSGHEELISVLKNSIFGLMYWDSSYRGGKHIFKFNK